MKRGFTLLEVCLAVAVMSAGVLSVVILYSMGFRETRQSREDVATAAYADAVMSPLVNALSNTNVTWSTFNGIKSSPDGGWGGYFDSTTGKVKDGISGIASSAYSAVPGAKAMPSAPQGFKAGLVIRHEQNSSIVGIAFRATRNPSMLMSAPMYYTEVRFHGGR